MTRRLCRLPLQSLLVGCCCLPLTMRVCFGDESPESPLPSPRMHAMPPGVQHHQAFAMPVMHGGPPMMNVPMPGMPGMPPIAGMPHAGHHQPAFGIMTVPVGPQLQAQLNLPDGMGLIVEQLDPAGAAAAAGLKRFDILRKFDDQILCSPQQLAALAKAAGKGKQVNLTVIRAAREQEVAVTLGDPEAKAVAMATGGRAEAHARAEAGGWPHAGGRAAGQAGGQSRGSAGQGGHWETHHTQRAVAESDDRGTVEIQETDGRRTVRVKDPSGREVHAGPLDTDADWEAVPEAFRGMVRDVAGKLGG
jgi:hypothetical protein